MLVRRRCQERSEQPPGSRENSVTSREDGSGAQRRAAAACAKRSETILIVDDEEALLTLTKRILMSVGYTVLTATTGHDAIQIWEANRADIKLVLTDVEMPQMGGRIMVERLRLLCPGLKVLYMSGYTDDAELRHGIGGSEVNFIGKPFNAAALRGKVRESLDRESDSGFNTAP